MTDTIELSSGGSTATIARLGAEPLSWRVAGRELLWHGDPAHWAFRAPILFPVVGASLGGSIRVAGQAYPMPQHGFARRSAFKLIGRDESSAHLRLTETVDTLAQYPFPFALDVNVALTKDTLRLGFTVTNTGSTDGMPYGLGFHPAFPWPFDGAVREGHQVVFERAEVSAVPEIAPGGLLARKARHVPLDDRVLPIAPELFEEALVFLNAKSRAFRFVAPSGAEIGMAVDGFPHLAVWSRPTAPFLSLEAWTAHADWEDATGEFSERPSLVHRRPGESAEHAVTMSWHAAEHLP